MYIHTYKKIAFNFLFFVFVLAIVVFYFIFYKVEIRVVPVKEKINVDFLVQIKEQNEKVDSDEKVINGEIKETEMEGEKEFFVSGVQEVATKDVGEVFIINKENFDQPLVATTRLLTPDNILFRIKTKVVVPAQGEVKVKVYPDSDDFKGVVPPTKLTIPGLSKSLQKTIYAENREELRGTREIKVLTQEDLNVSREILAQELYKQSKDKFKIDDKNRIRFNLIGRIPKIKKVEWREIISEKADKEVGTETEKFNLYLKIKAVEISFDENEIYDLAEKKLIEAVPDDKKFLKMDKKSFNYVPEDFDLNKKEAQIKVYAAGEMIISKDNRILDKEWLKGKNIKEAQDYLNKFPAIEKAEIRAPLPWLKFIPKNKNKIKIIIEKD